MNFVYCGIGIERYSFYMGMEWVGVKEGLYYSLFWDWKEKWFYFLLFSCFGICVRKLKMFFVVVKYVCWSFGNMFKLLIFIGELIVCFVLGNFRLIIDLGRSVFF